MYVDSVAGWEAVAMYADEFGVDLSLADILEIGDTDLIRRVKASIADGKPIPESDAIYYKGDALI